MYTTERNIQILISLMKQYGIKKVIASPGATNYTFVGSIQNDPFFEVYSCVDERSAAYLAIGMCDECNEPIALSCTGATASRNYMSGLTEAFYRKLPILAITSMEPRTNVGHLKAQQIDRSQLPRDIALESIYLPPIKDEEDAYQCMLSVNKALLALNYRGGGPVHIDIASTFGTINQEKIKPASIINRITQYGVFPEMCSGKIAVMIGAHKSFNEELTNAIDKFCASYNSIVLCVNPCNYSGEYAFRPGLLYAQLGCDKELKTFDLLIHIGETSSDYVGFSLNAKEVWRISEDGCLKDRYRSLTHVFEMPEYVFFNHYIKEKKEENTLLLSYKKSLEEVRGKMPDLPFSNCWIAQTLAPLIPDNSDLFLGIVNSLRVWDYANIPLKVNTHSNVGGYGIDGCLSTMIGSSLINSQKEFYGVFGDLAFFYDCNVLGNRHIGNNLHIIIVNNDGGQQFRNFDHPASSLGEQTNEFVAAAGHYGPKSPNVIKHLAQDFGFRYFAAATKEDFNTVIPHYFDKGSSIIIEVFISDKEEGEALSLLRNILPYHEGVVSSVKKAVIGTIGSENAQKLKSLFGKK
jgi:2-succinyl-5-enolpyruvyl-6-hydroxy-3-cyclohexene-1-carboxylate synthase